MSTLLYTEPHPAGYELSDADLKYFQDCAERWQRRLDLRRYHLTIIREPLAEGVNANVTFTPNSTNTAACVRLNTRQELPPTEETLNRAALHEMLHLLFAEMFGAVEDTSSSHAERAFRFERSEHFVIEVLSRLLLTLPDK